MRIIPFAICFAVAQLFAGEANDKKQEPQRPPQFSQQQLDQIRQSLMSQIAVWDSGENAMRAPTPAEAAALAPTAPTPAQTAVKLNKGGAALKRDASNVSFAVATIADDGTVKISHGTAASARKEAHAH